MISILISTPAPVTPGQEIDFTATLSNSDSQPVVLVGFEVPVSFGPSSASVVPSAEMRGMAVTIPANEELEVSFRVKAYTLDVTQSYQVSFAVFAFFSNGQQVREYGTITIQPPE